MDPLLPKQVRYQAALHADSQYSNRSQWQIERLSNIFALVFFSNRPCTLTTPFYLGLILARRFPRQKPHGARTAKPLAYWRQGAT